MNKSIVLAVPGLLLTLMSCGIQEQGSTVQTITAPDNKPYKPVDDFWLYETNAGIYAFSSDGSVPNIGYFPALMPTNGQDLFWLKEGLTRMSLIPDTNVIKPRHAQGVINRIVFPVGATASNSYAAASVTHRLFEGMKLETQSTMVLRPTFEVRGSLGSIVQVHFEAHQVCYKVLVNDPNPMRILNEDLAQTDRVTMLSRPDTAETVQPELVFNRTNVGAFAKQCSDLGGEVAAELTVEIRPLIQMGEITADFVGIAIHREFPALDKSKIFFAVSPNFPVNRDLKLQVESLEDKDMTCNILLKGKYNSPSDARTVGENLIRDDIVVVNKTMANEDAFLGSRELDVVGIPGIRYFSGEVVSYDCVEYIPRIQPDD